jgi:hypothetical protein
MLQAVKNVCSGHIYDRIQADGTHTATSHTAMLQVESTCNLHYEQLTIIKSSTMQEADAATSSDAALQL